MRYRNILRFVVLVFVVGSLAGLVGGLIFGGKGSANASAKQTQTTTKAADGASQDASTAGSQLGPVTAETAKAIGANEMGQVLVLEYHLISDRDSEWARTADEFRADIELLKEEGYYPINLRDLVTGTIDVPAGKSPVVITFDDSSPGQYRILEDGSLDPDCAVAILQAAVDKGDWASRASFYCLIDVQPADNALFGQPESRQEKLQNLVKWGYEVGSHTVSHLNLKKASKEESVKQLAQSCSILEEYIGGDYKVDTLSIPFGAYPTDGAILKTGEYEGKTYSFKAALEVSGGPSPSPFSTKFKAYHVLRIIVNGNVLEEAVKKLKDNPESKFVSDGDPAVISYPESPAENLGSLIESPGRPVVTY